MYNRNYQMSDSQTRSFMQKVYGWMAAGLSITALIAYMVASSPKAISVVATMPAMIVLVLLQLGLVFYLSMALQRLSASAAMGIFIAYAALTGVTMSTIFLAFTGASIALTFAVTAGMFTAMALYGYFTDSDLSSLGSFLMMGLVGLIIANVVNMFVQSANFDLVTAAFGVMIFTLFTAYDTQMIKRLGGEMIGDGEEVSKVAVIGSLKLYLDFINLFIYLLRFFGQRRND